MHWRLLKKHQHSHFFPFLHGLNSVLLKEVGRYLQRSGIYQDKASGLLCGFLPDPDKVPEQTNLQEKKIEEILSSTGRSHDEMSF